MAKKINHFIFCHNIVAKFLFIEKIATKTQKMKKGFNPREVLGLTQHQIAKLLNVSRSQWSMYELGQRDLPASAFLVLGDMMVYAQTITLQTAPKTEHQLKQAATLQVALQKLLQENAYQLERVARKLTPLEQKHQAQLKTLQLLAYLKTKNPNTGTLQSKNLERITTQTINGVTLKDLFQIVKWQIKLEQLQAEKKWLEERLKVMSDEL